ncbi:MAG: SGNH/GDSL hydrolase family protein [Sulfuricaulis sp.]|uniref:SGNH/GDSL hydrolase family protein n=1 Tax=Sulfuricaulis sp. TaxID=2003553 RepID=UPI0034A4FA0D
MINLLKRYKLHIATILVVLFIIEGLTYASFVLVISRKERSFIYDDYDALRNSVTLQELQRFRVGFYDKVTGWIPPSNSHDELSPDGNGIHWSYTIDSKRARRNPYAAKLVRISAYGDSFTFCDQVNDDQTWSYFLSKLTNSHVENWGVGGYGTDQALLRLKQNLPKYRTDIVVLGVFSENINRLMNSYRPFYSGSMDSMRLGFKPMLHNRNGKLEWLSNPLVFQSNLLEDYDRAYDKARQADYWYALNQRKAVFRFPYTLAFLRATHYYLSVGPRPNLYELDAAVEKLDRILEEFQSLARQHDFVGVVLFIPTSDAVKLQQRNGTYDYSNYVAHVRARGDLDRLRVVNIIERPFDRAKFNLRPFMFHASPYGNQIIAEAVHETIKDRL